MEVGLAYSLQLFSGALSPPLVRGGGGGPTKRGLPQKGLPFFQGHRTAELSSWTLKTFLGLDHSGEMKSYDLFLASPLRK